MTAYPYQWRELLEQWSRDILASPLAQTHAHLIPEVATHRHWLGYDGAPEAQIVHVEAKLGIALPPSYRSFLATTNGWRLLTTHVWRLPAVEELDWYRNLHTDMIDELDADDESYDVSPPPYGQSTYVIPSTYLDTGLDISAGWDGYSDAIDYLLNPQHISADGEWEALKLQWWKPSRYTRYRSFWDLMHAEYRALMKR